MNRPIALIPYIVLTAALAAGLIWHLGNLRAHDGTESIATGETISVGGPFALTDQNGVRRTDKDYSGKFMLIFFGYTYCPDVCPTTLAVISAALDKLGPRANKIVPLFITVDPKRDTPEKLKVYLANFEPHTAPHFVGLTGNDADVAQAAKAYRVYYQAHTEQGANYAVDHSSVIYLMGPDGRFITNYSLDNSPDMFAEDLGKRIMGP
jgi:protein SCO1/2